MNKITKAFIAILGGINAIFNMFIPIAIALLIVNAYKINGINLWILLIVACLSSMYKAIDVGFMK
jgi:hypothetical protein